jgi:hypothetical protein
MDDRLQISFEELTDGGALDKAQAEIKAELGKSGSRLASLNWSIFRDKAAASLKDEIARLDWIESLAGIYCKAAELRELAVKTKAAPGTEEPFALGEHPLSLDLHPIVTLTCPPVELPPLRFELKLEALVECAVLVVANGRLAAIESAILTPSANLYYGEHHLGELAKRKIPITQRYAFSGGGFEIPCD